MNRTFKALSVVVIAAVTMAMVSCSTQRRVAKQGVKRPTQEQIQAALDSICFEGYNLYIAERVNWLATDLLLERYSVESVGGNIIWRSTDSTWNVVFFDKNQNQCIFDLSYNIRSNERITSYDARPVTEAEQELWRMKSVMFSNLIARYGDSLQYNSNYGRPNFDFVRIDANTTRMYILQGVERPNIIPFGNDYSIDFDNSGNVVAFRRYHHSLIAIPTVDESGEKVASVVHSHLQDNPYITPTDICNFMLYRGEMKQTYVYSTALDGYIIYDAETGRALFLTSEAMHRIAGGTKR